MLAIPSPLGDVGFGEGQGISVSSRAWEPANHEQYRGQWGEDWLRLVERERLSARESIFQESATQWTTGLSGISVAVAPADRPSESVEMEWLINHAHAVEQYKGEWLMIYGRELVAHSRDFSRIRAIIAERRIQSPFLYYVPTDEESNCVTI
jgi:hypothetical protein